MRRWLVWAPLLAFGGLLLVVTAGLIRPADRVVRSAMIGRPVPAFTLPPIVPGKAGFGSADLGQGEARLINVFASWCAPCVGEAPMLLQLKQAGIRIDGVAVRDTGPALAQFLARNGDAYDRIGSDRESRVQLALGSSGVPESFVVDGRGRIVLQHVGGIGPDDVAPIIDAVRAAR